MSGARTPGREAEDAAAVYLETQGLKVIERNYHSRFGEIDLIMRDGHTLVFVEVRARRSSAYGGAAASITAAKRDRLIAAARQYLAGQARLPACRFDVVLLEGDPPRVEWLRNAFDA